MDKYLKNEKGEYILDENGNKIEIKVVHISAVVKGRSKINS